MIPKCNQEGKWRLILDLSSPTGNSVNDGIQKDTFSVQYMQVDDIINAVMELGRGTLIAKFDIQNAYRIVPIHPDDRHLLGVQWRNQFYLDMTLPFGLRSAPYIFTSIADLVEWSLKQNHGVGFLEHYLDNFHTFGPPNSVGKTWTHVFIYARNGVFLFIRTSSRALLLALQYWGSK